MFLDGPRPGSGSAFEEGAGLPAEVPPLLPLGGSRTRSTSTGKRGYKEAAHGEWERVLGRREFDAVRPQQGVRLFVEGLQLLIHGRASHEERFVRFGETLAALLRRQTQVHTWPLQTMFGFIARPDREIFLKPVVTQNAAEEYGYLFQYARSHRGRPARACSGSRRCSSGIWRAWGRGT